MRLFSINFCIFLGVAAITRSESVLEASNFSVTEALISHGINVSQTPTLQSMNGCAGACAALKSLYGDADVAIRGEAPYDDFTSAYWSANQAAVTPLCIFSPSDDSQISVVVLIARLTQCPFAAKSGGHAAFAGASSAQGGITISFAHLNNVTLSGDRKIASIGPGNVWGSVYEQLARADVSVIGGRLYNIGVGGLVTGGGISYFSNLYGWACDNVDSYVVVLANGAIVEASTKQHPDLYWALRGGGNNLGLVVRFNLRTIPLPRGEMWVGTRVYGEDVFPEVTDALANIINDSQEDPKAGIFLVWTYMDGSQLAGAALYYSQPNAGNATIWTGFNTIPSVSDTTQNRILADWANETMKDTPPGLREVYYSMTTQVDDEILVYARDVFYKTVSSVAHIPGIVPNLVVQGITRPQLDQMAKNGGNVLGIDRPLLIMQLCAMWDNASDDHAVYSWMSDVLEAISIRARALGVHSKFVYMNYASQFQDVIETYNTKNKKKLQRVARRYDPEGVFQVLQPGYFKLNRAPVPDSGYFSH